MNVSMHHKIRLHSSFGMAKDQHHNEIVVTRMWLEPLYWRSCAYPEEDAHN